MQHRAQTVYLALPSSRYRTSTLTSFDTLASAEIFLFVRPEVRDWPAVTLGRAVIQVPLVLARTCSDDKQTPRPYVHQRQYCGFFLRATIHDTVLSATLLSLHLPISVQAFPLHSRIRAILPSSRVSDHPRGSKSDYSKPLRQVRAARMLRQVLPVPSPLDPIPALRAARQSSPPPVVVFPSPPNLSSPLREKSLKYTIVMAMASIQSCFGPTVSTAVDCSMYHFPANQFAALIKNLPDDTITLGCGRL